jgi:4-hydroxy-tetrahydrodipicolinate synthase
VVCGTTGETASLLEEERDTLITTAIRITKKKVPIIVGCGTASLLQTIDTVKKAKEFGADAALVVTPYYVKPTQEGILAYFKALHDAVDLPIILYNNPGRTVVDMSIDTIIKLCDLKRIVGIKDSKLEASRFAKIREITGNRLALLSGEDSAVGAHLLNGADGAISVVANVAPKLCVDQMNAWFSGDLGSFKKISDNLMKICDVLSLDVNPVTIKYAVSKLGFCDGQLRLPMVECQSNVKSVIDAVLEDLEVISKTSAKVVPIRTALK